VLRDVCVGLRRGDLFDLALLLDVLQIRNLLGAARGGPGDEHPLRNHVVVP
jgi:hypothetical protein